MKGGINRDGTAANALLAVRTMRESRAPDEVARKSTHVMTGKVSDKESDGGYTLCSLALCDARSRIMHLHFEFKPTKFENQTF